jgi:hypothetical protein
MKKFIEEKPSISKKINILLIKLAQHLERVNVKNVRFDFRSDCDDEFELVDVYFDETKIEGDSPFRSGGDFQSFFDDIAGELKSTVLDGNEEDDSQEFSLHFKAESIENGKTRWGTSFSYSDTVNKSEDQEHICDPDHFGEDPIYREIIQFMKNNKAENLIYFFSGGGDSGDLNELAIEVEREVIEAKTILIDETGERVSFETILYDHCMHALMSVIDNWYDGNGGSGSITINDDGKRTLIVSFDNYELEESIADEAIALPIPISTTTKNIEIHSSMEPN